MKLHNHPSKKCGSNPNTNDYKVFERIYQNFAICVKTQKNYYWEIDGIFLYNSRENYEKLKCALKTLFETKIPATYATTEFYAFVNLLTEGAL